MGEVIHVDFRLRPEKVAKASREIIAAAKVIENYADPGIAKLAQEDQDRAVKNLSRREVMEVNKQINKQPTDKAS